MKRRKRGLIWKTAVLALVLFLAAGLYGKPQATYYVITDAGIPAGFQDYTICIVGDTHLMDTDTSLGDIVGLVKRQNPDLIVLVGDIYDITSDIHSTPVFVEELTSVAPVLSVSGNHDRWHVKYKALMESYEALGVVTLEGGKSDVVRDGERLSFFGIPDTIDAGEAARVFIDGQIARLNRKYGIDSEGFNILLFHRANLFDLFFDREFDLVLAGHMHGGQIRLPFVGGLLSPHGELFPEYTSGVFQLGEDTGVVTRGIGNTKWVPRFFNRPEVVVLRLDHGS